MQAFALICTRQLMVLVAFVVNVLVVYFFWKAMGFNEIVGWVCLAVISYSMLFLTVFADSLIAAKLRARKPTPAEAERLDIAVSELRQLAVEKKMPFPRHVRLRVLDEGFFESVAFGHRSVAISSEMLELAGPQMIRAVVAHEFAHLVNGDTVPYLKLRAWSGASVALASIVGPMIELVREVFAGPGQRRIFSLGDLVFEFILLIFALIIIGTLYMLLLIPMVGVVVFGVCNSVLSLFSQAQEYSADEYAIRLTGDYGLLCFFQVVQVFEEPAKKWYRPSLWISHPPTALRIERGNAILAEVRAAPNGPIVSL